MSSSSQGVPSAAKSGKRLSNEFEMKLLCKNFSLPRTGMPSEVSSMISKEVTTSATTSSSSCQATSESSFCMKSRASRGLHLSRSPQDLMIPVNVFCKAFPFHFICDPDLKILQIGSGFMRILGRGNKFLGVHVKTFFEIEQPHLNELSFDAILGKTNVTFVIRNVINASSGSRKLSVGQSSTPSHVVVNVTSPSKVTSSSSSPSLSTSVENVKLAAPLSTGCPFTRMKKMSNPSSSLNPTSTLASNRRVSMNPVVTEGVQIKGQMIHCPESKCLLFLGSPLVDGMDSMTSKGLFLSDIPIHGE